MGRLSEALLGDRPQFDGVTYVAERDQVRLTGQLNSVRYILLDHKWHTLAEIAKRAGGSEAGVSARLRDLRKEKFGGHQIDRECVADGLWRYRMAP